MLAAGACSKEPSRSHRATPEDALWESGIASLEASIPTLMENHKIPGVSIALIREARVVRHLGFGVRDRTSDARVDAAAMFEAASMSKPVFAYVVMKLCERGVLDLDTRLTRYAAEPFLKGDPRLDLITARHVLSHTSGFQEIRSGANPLRIQFAPGEKWQYSGEGYAYLQSVVTALTGRVDHKDCSTYEADMKVCATDFDAYMRTYLLEPLGMRSSGYVWNDAFSQHMAHPHDDQDRPLTPGKHTPADVARYGAVGGLLTTATYYAQFMIEVMDPKRTDAFRLNPASLREMLRPQIKVESGSEYTISWALGWKIAQTAEFGDLVSHGGDQTGFHSIAEFSPARRSGYVMLTNGENGWQLIQEMAPRIAQGICRDFSRQVGSLVR